MKSIIAAAVLLLLSSSASLVNAGGEPATLHPTILEKHINNNPNSTWKAALKNQFSYMTREQAQTLLGAQVPKYERYTEQQMRIMAEKQMEEPLQADNPKEFDTRKKWPNCVHGIRDQEKCGSCWAFSGSEVFSDRFCIASKGQIDVIFSPQDMVSCNWYNFGCNGGQLFLAWEYMKHTGLVPDKCMPYVSGNGTVPSCPHTCVDGKTPLKSLKYKMAKFHKVSPLIEFWKREKAIETALIEGGPVQTGFTVYQDFMSYSSGVYQHTTGSALGGHAVKIVGYGFDEETETKYWIVANSWNTSWGMDGYFWIKKGDNECGIEADVYAGEPNLKDVPTFY